MQTIISDQCNFPMYYDFAYAFCRKLCLDSNIVDYKGNQEVAMQDVYMNNFPLFICNRTLHPYSNCTIDYSVMQSDKFTKVGHLYSDGFLAVFPSELSDDALHVMDIINASFFSMKSDPSFSKCLLQAYMSLHSLYTETLKSQIGTVQSHGVKPYEL